MMWSSSAMRSGWDDERNMAAHSLPGSVTEETLGRSVPALNDAVERLADDGIIRGFDDRREQPSCQQLAGPVPIHTPLRRDVPERSGHIRKPGRVRP